MTVSIDELLRAPKQVDGRISPAVEGLRDGRRRTRLLPLCRNTQLPAGLASRRR